MPGLDDTTVTKGLQRLPSWERCGNQLAKTFVRADVARAMVFVNEVAAAAEVAGHHPDIDIRCRRLLPRHHRTPWPVAWPARWARSPGQLVADCCASQPILAAREPHARRSEAELGPDDP